MILCVDVGNTSIKCGRVRDGRVERVVGVASRAPSREIERAVAGAAGASRMEMVAVASVRPASTAAVVRAIRRRLGVEPVVVTHRSRLPLEIATRRPARVGIDRICAACAAVAGRTRDAIVVDAGTAITVDLVRNRRFLGGVILAGPQTALAGLHQQTAGLPDLRWSGAAPGGFDDTPSAMAWGALLGAVGGVEAAVAMLEAHARTRPPRWLTGGDAPGLRGRLHGRWKHVPYLTLMGIAEIARLNRPARG